MSNSVFLDTNGWLALFNATDSQHDSAERAWRSIITGGRHLVLTDWVVAETGNGLARYREKSRLLESLDRILQARRGMLVFIDDDLMRRAIHGYQRYGDKAWGLVDCSSFIVMQDHGITDAFTSDRHFEQAGFNCLLKT